MEMGNTGQIAQTNGNGAEVGINQICMGTFIINVFPFSHNVPSKICI